MNVAIYIVGTIKKGEPIKATDIELLNGKQPKSGDVMVCGSCGRQFQQIHTAGWCE
jgi:hypothetical protein